MGTGKVIGAVEESSKSTSRLLHRKEETSPRPCCRGFAGLGEKENEEERQKNFEHPRTIENKNKKKKGLPTIYFA